MATAIKSRPVTSRLLAHLVPVGRLLGLVPPAPGTLAELRRRGLDARAQQVLRLLTGEHCDRSVFRKATREELWAFGFGPLCACGERGLSPWEEADDVCKACREFAEPNGGAA